MKLKLLCIAISIFSLNYSFSQAKFYYNELGETIDSSAYYKAKKEYVDALKKMETPLKAEFKDQLTLLKQTPDSTIYSYNWKINFNESKDVKNTPFSEKKYLYKPFVINSFKSIDGETITLKSLKGKPTIIHIWNNDCKACIEQIPILNKIKNKLGNTVNYIALTDEEKKTVTKYANKHKFGFTQIANDKKAIRTLKPEYFPINIILNEKGVVTDIRYGNTHYFDSSKKIKLRNGEELESLIVNIMDNLKNENE